MIKIPARDEESGKEEYTKGEGESGVLTLCSTARPAESARAPVSLAAKGE